MNYRMFRGFTLIEVMVALLVVAIAYAGVATAISDFADQRLLLIDRQVSHRIAWNRMMEQFMLSRGIALNQPNLDGHRGVVAARGIDWQWEMTEQKASGKGLVRYHVDVYRRGDSAQASPTGSLTAFFTRPTGVPGE